MGKILLDGEIKRVKSNVRTGKDKIAYDSNSSINNFGVTLKIHTVKYGQIFFTINNEDIIKLAEQKEKEQEERQLENQIRVNEYLSEFGYY